MTRHGTQLEFNPEPINSESYAGYYYCATALPVIFINQPNFSTDKQTTKPVYMYIAAN